MPSYLSLSFFLVQHDSAGANVSRHPCHDDDDDDDTINLLYGPNNTDLFITFFLNILPLAFEHEMHRQN
jgi:hypothetical protein